MKENSSKMSEPVTVAIINYNGMEYLKDEIESIKASDYPNISIALVDDCSTDGSVEFVKKYYPEVKIYQMEYNKRFLGKFPLANRVRNKVLQAAETRLIFLLDNDITLEVDCISKLVEAINELPDCGVCTPRVMYMEHRDTIYSDGAVLHYVGTSVVRNRNVKLSAEKEKPKYSVGCGIQLVDKFKAEKVDFTDENFVVGWGDDGEFHHRMNIAGFRCYNVPQAMVYHPKKDSGFIPVAHVKNRWWIMLPTYSIKTIILTAPAVLIYEISLIFFLIIKGELKSYFISIKDVLFNFKKIMKKRKKIQTMRVIADRELIGSGNIFFATKNVGDNIILRMSVAMLIRFFDLYWKIIRKFI